MAFKITISPRFEKQYKLLDSQIKNKVKNKLGIIIENPSLRSKRIQGTNNLFESSINMDIRIVWYYEENIIVLVDIGHHDVLKAY